MPGSCGAGRTARDRTAPPGAARRGWPWRPPPARRCRPADGGHPCDVAKRAFPRPTGPSGRPAGSQWAGTGPKPPKPRKRGPLGGPSVLRLQAWVQEAGSLLGMKEKERAAGASSRADTGVRGRSRKTLSGHCGAQAGMRAGSCRAGDGKSGDMGPRRCARARGAARQGPAPPFRVRGWRPVRPGCARRCPPSRPPRRG